MAIEKQPNGRLLLTKAARELLIIRRSKGELIDEYLKNKHKDEPTYCDYVLSYITKRKQDWIKTWRTAITAMG